MMCDVVASISVPRCEQISKASQDLAALTSNKQVMKVLGRDGLEARENSIKKFVRVAILRCMVDEAMSKSPRASRR